jgi:translocation and assembly module TamB
VRDLHITGDAAELTANVTMSTDALALDGEYQLTLPRLAALSGMVKTPLAGKLTVNGKIGGRLAAPSLTARMRSPALSVDEVLVGAMEARVTVAQLTNELSGHFDLAVDHPRLGKVGLASRFSGVADDTFYFRELVVESQDTKLTGAMAINLSNATVTGKLAGQALSLASWSELAGHTLSGSASVVVDMRASGASQQIDLALDADGLNVTLGPEQILTVDTLTASARVEDLFGTPTGGLRVVAGDSKISDFQLDDVVFEARTDGPRHASGSLQARGDIGGPFDLQVLGDYRAIQAGFVVTVSELGVSLSGQSVKLTKPTRFEHDGETAVLSETILSVAGGTLTVSGEIGTERIAARLALERISLLDLGTVVPMADLTGTLSGHARLSGSRSAPVAEMELRSADMRSAHTTLAAAPPASGRLRGDWRDGRLQLTASLTEIADTRIDARASLPLQLDPVTLALAVRLDGVIDGSVNWSGEIGPVWDLLSAYEDRFTGPGDLALTLAGTVGNPQVNGHFRVAGGRYENVLTGTTLSDVQLRLVGDGDKLVLQQLTAGDDQKGTLEGSGTIDFLPARSYPTNLRLEFSDMLLVARDDLTLNASGNLLFAGTLSNALLRGEIVTGPSELSLVGALPSQVVELDVEEINVKNAAHATIKAPASAAEPSVVILDLNISVPGRAFVRGLGLDSEWMGNVKISGNTNAPNVAGVLNPVRGRFSLMGKSFRLERGAIRFTGTDDVDPLLDLTAEHKTKNLTAMVRVTGSASKPKISLTSRPPLPESEIASQVLFGTDSSKLSPAQSLQLASAIATYSGTGGAVGILDATRRALGVDVINFAESEQDPDTTRVSIGKYVTEGVYIEVERGAEQSSRTSTTVEVEVLPDVRIQGGTTETGGNKVGVKWQWDY